MIKWTNSSMCSMLTTFSILLGVGEEVLVEAWLGSGLGSEFDVEGGDGRSRVEKLHFRSVKVQRRQVGRPSSH